MCKRNARQSSEGPPVRCHHWTPYSIPLLTALRRFANPFRVASFGRADLTLFPEMSPVTCEGDTTLMLASCKGIYAANNPPRSSCLCVLFRRRLGFPRNEVGRNA